MFPIKMLRLVTPTAGFCAMTRMNKVEAVRGTATKMRKSRTLSVCIPPAQCYLAIYPAIWLGWLLARSGCQ